MGVDLDPPLGTISTFSPVNNWGESRHTLQTKACVSPGMESVAENFTYRAIGAEHQTC